MQHSLFCRSNAQRRDYGWEVRDKPGPSSAVFTRLVVVLQREVISFQEICNQVLNDLARNDSSPLPCVLNKVGSNESNEAVSENFEGIDWTCSKACCPPQCDNGLSLLSQSRTS